jgi:hypothetical protein
VDFRLGGRRVARDRRRPFAATISRAATRRAHSRRLRARAFVRDGRRITLSRTLAACRAPRGGR